MHKYRSDHAMNIKAKTPILCEEMQENENLT